MEKALMSVLVQSISNVLASELCKVLEKRKRKRRIWVKDWISRRQTLGASNLLLYELEKEDESRYRNHLRMSSVKFKELLSKVSHKIQKLDTRMREAVPAKVKLEITLRFLAAGSSFGTLEYLYRVPKSTMSTFIPDVCDAICEELKEFIKVPSTADEWNKIEEGFRVRWNFPGCIGAIDGKHVVIRAPHHCGSNFFNYKGTNSIILLALVDDNYCFTYVDIGCNGRASDGGVFGNSSLFRVLEERRLEIPENSVTVGDEAFPLKKYLMKPYPLSGGLDERKKNYNYRLSRSRRIVENAFGILVSRFRIFEKPISLSPEKTDKIVKAACSLHNWLRKICIADYTERNYTDPEDMDRGAVVAGLCRQQKPSQGIQDIQEPLGSNLFSREAKAIREKYADYFSGEGAVPWQQSMIR